MPLAPLELDNDALSKGRLSLSMKPLGPLPTLPSVGNDNTDRSRSTSKLPGISRSGDIGSKIPKLESKSKLASIDTTSGSGKIKTKKTKPRKVEAVHVNNSNTSKIPTRMPRPPIKPQEMSATEKERWVRQQKARLRKIDSSSIARALDLLDAQESKAKSSKTPTVRKPKTRGLEAVSPVITKTNRTLVPKASLTPVPIKAAPRITSAEDAMRFLELDEEDDYELPLPAPIKMKKASLREVSLPSTGTGRNVPKERKAEQVVPTPIKMKKASLREVSSKTRSNTPKERSVDTPATLTHKALPALGASTHNVQRPATTSLAPLAPIKGTQNVSAIEGCTNFPAKRRNRTSRRSQ